MSSESGSISDEIQYSNSDSESKHGNQPAEIIDLIIDKLMEVEEEQEELENFVTSDIHERVQTIERMFSSCESFVTIEPMRIPKSNDESFNYEEAGILEYSKGNCNKALFLYNKSIAFAERDYPDLYSLYERRANALREMKLFKAYLHTLELVIKYCPSDLKQKYEQEKEHFIPYYTASLSIEASMISECQFNIDSLTKIANDRKHPDVPFIANCLELRDTANYGRAIFTNCDLNPGDVVAIDRAYTSILYGTYQYRHCSNCMKENWSLIPCPGCTTTMYCNQKCLQIAWKKFHKHECDISNYLMKILPDNYLMYFRSPLQTIELFGGVDPLIEYEEMSQQMYGGSFSVFDMRHENIQYDDDGEIVHYADNENFNSRVTPLNYHPVHGLIKDIQEPANWPIDMHLRAAVFTLLTYRILRDIFDITTDNQKRFVEKLIFRYILAAIMFNYGLYIGRKIKEQIIFGNVFYPFASLINHSCAPNLTFEKNGSSVTIIVVHPITAGDQLFNYYGSHYLCNTKQERQSELKSIWDFDCQCIACIEDYPRLRNLPIYCLPYGPNETQVVAPMHLKLKRLIENINALYMFRRSHLKCYLCKEICFYELHVTEFLTQLLRRMSGSVYMNC